MTIKFNQQEQYRKAYHNILFAACFIPPFSVEMVRYRITSFRIASYPYRRVLALDSISLEVKARLTNQYVQLNPVTLRNTIEEKVAILWNINR
jgi:hypothetical protein